jgi:hypothetical protein
MSVTTPPANTYWINATLGFAQMPAAERLRSRTFVVLTAIALAAGALTLLLLAGSAQAAGAGTSRPTATTNRNAAARDATVLLGRLALLPGATKLPAEPSGDGGVLARPASGPPAVSPVIDRHRWWTVPGRNGAVTAFIRAHAPRGGKLLMSGAGVRGPGLPAGHVLAYQWAAVRGVLWSRELVIAVVDLPGGRAGIRADAQVQWTIPRPADERIPAGAHELDVTRGLPGTAPTLRVHVIDLARIRRLAAMIDQLETVQPGVWACPVYPVKAPIVTFTFRARLDGAALAVAREPAFATEPTTPCDPMTFSIRGRTRRPLLGGATVVRAAGRMLGIRLHVPIKLS